jgi:hypothetical protein
MSSGWSTRLRDLNLNGSILLVTALLGLVICAPQESIPAPSAAVNRSRDSWVTDVPVWSQETLSYLPIGEGNVAQERVVPVPTQTTE